MPLTRRRYKWEIKFAAAIPENDKQYDQKFWNFLHSLLSGYFTIKSLEYNPVQKKYFFIVTQRKGHELLTKEAGAESIRRIIADTIGSIEVLN